MAAQDVEVADATVVGHQVDARLEDHLPATVGENRRLDSVHDLLPGDGEVVDVGAGHEPQPDAVAHPRDAVMNEYLPGRRRA